MFARIQTGIRWGTFVSALALLGAILLPVAPTAARDKKNDKLAEPITKGQRVFTCLSHDIIAHEVTHAIIDGIRTYFTQPSNPDVLAFHEAFADLAALFNHFVAKKAQNDGRDRLGFGVKPATVAYFEKCVPPAPGRERDER